MSVASFFNIAENRVLRILGLAGSLVPPARGKFTMVRKARAYEIGNVYQFKGTLFLAVDTNLLVTFKNQELIKRKPIVKYKQVKFISVDELCSKWGIDIDQLDKLMSSEIKPPQTKRTSPSGNRRKGGEVINNEYYQLRLGRVLRA